MDSRHLNAEQLEALSSKAAMLAYLHRLQDRMERVGFPPDDELYKLVKQAYDAMHHLRVNLHYRSVDAMKK